MEARAGSASPKGAATEAGSRETCLMKIKAVLDAKLHVFSERSREERKALET
jgi:hypothetical protein